MRVNSDEEAMAFRKAIDEYYDRVAEEAKKRRERLRAELLDQVGDLGGNAKLVEWAKQKHLDRKENGVGRGMCEERGTIWELGCLARSVRDVCDAFGIDPAKLKELCHD